MLSRFRAEPLHYRDTVRDTAGKSHDDIPYLAPEVLEGGEPSTAADCFAFGIIMYEVLQGELVAGEVAMHADLNSLKDEDALKRHAARVVEGERYRSQISPRVTMASCRLLMFACDSCRQYSYLLHQLCECECEHVSVPTRMGVLQASCAVVMAR